MVPNPAWQVSFWEEIWTQKETPEYTPREKTLQRGIRRAAICVPGSGLRGHNPSKTFVLDF